MAIAEHAPVGDPYATFATAVESRRQIERADLEARLRVEQEAQVHGRTQAEKLAASALGPGLWSMGWRIEKDRYDRLPNYMVLIPTFLPDDVSELRLSASVDLCRDLYIASQSTSRPSIRFRPGPENVNAEAFFALAEEIVGHVEGERLLRQHGDGMAAESAANAAWTALAESKLEELATEQHEALFWDLADLEFAYGWPAGASLTVHQIDPLCQPVGADRKREVFLSLDGVPLADGRYRLLTHQGVMRTRMVGVPLAISEVSWSSLDDAPRELLWKVKRGREIYVHRVDDAGASVGHVYRAFAETLYLPGVALREAFGAAAMTYDDLPRGEGEDEDGLLTVSVGIKADGTVVPYPATSAEGIA